MEEHRCRFVIRSLNAWRDVGCRLTDWTGRLFGATPSSLSKSGGREMRVTDRLAQDV
jgi:hypothetical protein